MIGNCRRACMSKISRGVFTAIAVATFSADALAGPAADALSKCLAESTTGKDRKDMARWIFVGMSSHPDIKDMSNVTEKDRTALDKSLAAMLTRLMTES